MIRIVVPGAAGKMGKMIVEALAERPGEVILGGAVERPGHTALGQPASAPGSTVVSDDLAAVMPGADAIIDFTAPEATRGIVELAARHKVAAVIGTTGLSADTRAAIFHAGATIPIVVSPNFSIGVNLLLELVEQAARKLGPTFDLEVVEFHHRAKRDAPSGTAIAIAEALARGRDADLSQVKRYSREGDVGARIPGEIGVVAVRGGDIVGEHIAHFLGAAERLEIAHRATSRLIFARGAVHAAIWSADKPPGVYSMRDVLNG